MNNDDAKAKRTKSGDLSSMLNRAVVTATELAQALHSALERGRSEQAKTRRGQEKVMAILQQQVDIRGQIKRQWQLIPENDKQTLRDFGFQEPRKG